MVVITAATGAALRLDGNFVVGVLVRMWAFEGVEDELVVGAVV